MELRKSRDVELEALIDQILVEQQQEASANYRPVKLKHGRSHAPEAHNQIAFQKCGGGRRVVRKHIGSN